MARSELIPDTPSGMTAAEALSAWLEHLAHERRLSPRTLEAYGHIGRLYLAFMERHRGEALSLADMATVTAAERQNGHLSIRRPIPTRTSLARLDSVDSATPEPSGAAA